MGKESSSRKFTLLLEDKPRSKKKPRRCSGLWCVEHGAETVIRYLVTGTPDFAKSFARVAELGLTLDSLTSARQSGETVFLQLADKGRPLQTEGARRLGFVTVEFLKRGFQPIPLEGI